MKQFLLKLFNKYAYIRNHFINPKRVIKKIFYLRTGYYPNLDNPKTFNEKMQWMKLNYHDPLHTQLVDKAAVKEYVSSIIGEEYVIPTLGVWKRFNDIDFDSLPNQFVLKCTHDSGGLVICRDKNKLDISAAKKKINKCLGINYYYLGFEWPYKNVEPQILAEEYKGELSSGTVLDYKFFVFNGVPRILKIASNRNIETGHVDMDFYDMNFNHLPFKRGHDNSSIKLEKPTNFELMKELAQKLAKGLPFVRVDFYEIGNKVYFGELTFYPCGGWNAFDPREWDEKLGDMLELPKKNK
ncbi:MAG: glycosyl transferase [Muribaculaceae bacterium]|nr:glycosyl transferase [Muribaculaceae bacterium]